MDTVLTHLLFVAIFIIGFFFIYEKDTSNYTHEQRWLSRYFFYGFIFLNGLRWVVFLIPTAWL